MPDRRSHDPVTVMRPGGANSMSALTPTVRKRIERARKNGRKPYRTERPSEEWRAEAACRGNLDLMHTYELEREAQKVCHACPVVNECLDYSLKTRQPIGVWGGMTYKQREKLIKAGARNARTARRIQAQRDAREADA